MIGRVCRLDYSQPGKPAIDWDDSPAKQTLISDLVNDALAVLAELAGENAPQREDKAADALGLLGLLALVAGQDVEPGEGSDGTDGRWRIARKVAGDRVISTVDPEARHTRKGTVNLGGWVCGGACQCPVVTHSVVVSGGGQADDLIPGGEPGGHFAAVGIGAKPVAAGSKVRGDAAERREEPLRVPGRGELLHRSFPCSGGLVGVLGPVVQIL